MKTSARLIAASALFATALCNGAVQAAYTEPAPFNRPGYTSTQPWDINGSGMIVGTSDGEAFVYEGGVFSTLVHPDATNGTSVTGAADDGTLVGSYWISDGGDAAVQHGYIYSGGVFTPFDVPGATGTSVRHVSSDGRYLSGTWTDETESYGYAYDRQAATLTTFGDSSEFGTIAQGVNSRGQVTGSFFRGSFDGDWVSGSFVFDLTTGTRNEYFDVNGLQRPRFRDINDSGVITGFVGNQAFVGTPGNWHVFAPPTGAIGMYGYGLNEAGVLVGYYLDSDSTSGWISSPVPEPGSWLMMVLGLGAVGWRARRGGA